MTEHIQLAGVDSVPVVGLKAQSNLVTGRAHWLLATPTHPEALPEQEFCDGAVSVQSSRPRAREGLICVCV